MNFKLKYFKQKPTFITMKLIDVRRQQKFQI